MRLARLAGTRDLGAGPTRLPSLAISNGCRAFTHNSKALSLLEVSDSFCTGEFTSAGAAPYTTHTGFKLVHTKLNHRSIERLQR